LKTQPQTIQEQQQIKTITDQLAHDIRSPLSSLRMIVHGCAELSETNRTTLRAVCDRISDIAYNLLKYSKPEHYTDALGKQNKLKPVKVSADLMEIITEKRYEYSLHNIKFTSKFNNNNDIIINLDSQAFKRSISNIINNAVDAFDNRAGEVIVSLNVEDNEVQIIIEDNANGMPESIREKILNNIPITYNKTNGHGIAYSQIHDMLAKNNGTLQIQSKQNIGTKIILTFPKVANNIYGNSQVPFYGKIMQTIIQNE